VLTLEVARSGGGGGVINMVSHRLAKGGGVFKSGILGGVVGGG